MFDSTCVIESYSKDISGMETQETYTPGSSIPAHWLKRDGGSSSSNDRTGKTARVRVNVMLPAGTVVKPNDRIVDPDTGRKYRVLDFTSPRRAGSVHHIVAMCEVFVSSGS